jgi:hypothetical protein
MTLGEPRANRLSIMQLYLFSYMVPEGEQILRGLNALTGSANAAGGWGYQPNRASRLEPTSWALLAIGQSPIETDLTLHSGFLEKCVRSGGYLVEDPRWPANIGFNAFVAFAWLNHRELAAEDKIRALVGWLAGVKGVQAPQTTSYRQDNSLQGWAWLDATFSWVEPTSWGVLALQKALRAGFLPEGPAGARIAEAERLLIDRSCRDGGWNFGNANVMGQDLFPHVPTTAIALLALQRRRDEPAVVRSLAFLESHWNDEPSTLALGLSLICLRTYGRPTDAIRSQLLALASKRTELAAAPSGGTQEPQNSHALAVALTALAPEDNDALFKI